jgi:RimJ/RimL family protein N-acetyltransferase
LCAAISDGELWKLHVTIVPHPDAIDDFLANAQASYAAGEGIVYTTIDRSSGKVVGSTRFMKSSPGDKRVEIGFTFLAQSFQRTKINTEAKLLMLEYAFDTMQLNRVELLTDYLNSRSRNAILRIGAKEEGVLRSHKIMPNGRVRDSVIFSIIQNEWPGIKQHLQAKLVS